MFKVVSLKKTKKQYSCSVDRSSNITCLVTVNAKGEHLKTLVIFKGKKINVADLADIPKELLVTSSENGWIDSEIKFQWMQECIQQLDLTKRYSFI